MCVQGGCDFHFFTCPTSFDAKFVSSKDVVPFEITCPLFSFRTFDPPVTTTGVYSRSPPDLFPALFAGDVAFRLEKPEDQVVFFRHPLDAVIPHRLALRIFASAQPFPIYLMLRNPTPIFFFLGSDDTPGELKVNTNFRSFSGSFMPFSAV